jgi:epoxyqueuosine reductase
MDAPALKAALAAQARAEGFAGMGVCRPDAVGEAGARLRLWVGQGLHGGMGWMADRLDWRAEPAALWPEARSVVMLAEPYPPAADPLDALETPERAAISVYAQGADYHDVAKKRLKRLGRWLVGRAGGAIKVFVDTAPVMEKPLAEAAGLGWQGKHTNLVSRDLGSWFFLGALLTTLDLPADAPHEDRCGSCRACLDVCPTAAFPAPRVLDARRCISYLTIEHAGPIPRPMRPLLGNRI